MQRLAVVTEDGALRESLRASLCRSGLFELQYQGLPDLIMLGSTGSFPEKDFASACLLSGKTGKIPIILATTKGSEYLAVQALRHGITAYVTVPLICAELESLMLSLFPLARGPGLAGGECMIGISPSIHGIKGYVEKVARTMSNVLITGETGTGKELIAQLIHKNSGRADKPFLCINAACVPDTLLESELFGYERGAFTGAHGAQDGKLKFADGGTVFLDEIGDMSPYAQAKMLRVIESREIQRLGARKPQRVDFRIIAATNRDLDSLSTTDGFRRDLFFRLNVARIHLPPLRERKEDILPLAHFFREENNRKFRHDTSGFSGLAEQLLLSHDWPGNIRELKNTIEASFINLEPGAGLVDLPAPLCRVLEKKDVLPADELERILRALSETHWNKTRAAEKLHWSRMTLYRKMSRYQLNASGHPAKSA
ncbi:MAG TPA: sigma-54-dependent Fis family transcriptional regulator [Blattabacteriaceae bacterium]|nr:sigma-54-dependent Fis family transcriptional regulator [Blattabacteriaceae bacterium]